MEILAEYSVAIWGIWVILFTIFVQSYIATIAHRKQKSYIPGIIKEDLGQESFVFRSNRTFLNSCENLVLFFPPAVLAIFTGFSTVWLAILVWIYAVTRLVHMILYYAIATDKNPSPRSHFYMTALLSNLVLFITLALHLAGLM